MTLFITRVELHGAHTSADYDKLHAAMRQEGFTRTITSKENVTYHLPTAQYEYEGNVTKADVLGKAKQAAKKTQKEFGVIVTESNGSTWDGLPKV